MTAKPSDSAIRALGAVALLFAACLLGGGCARRAEAASSSGISPDGGEPQVREELYTAAEVAAAKTALAWVALLTKHDAESLVAATRAPFLLRDDARKPHCKNGVARTSDQVTATLKCLLNYKLLGEVMESIPRPLAAPIDRESMPRWVIRWTNRIRRDIYPISIVYAGDRASFDFLVLASADGVYGVTLHKSVECHD